MRCFQSSVHSLSNAHGFRAPPCVLIIIFIAGTAAAGNFYAGTSPANVPWTNGIVPYEFTNIVTVTADSGPGSLRAAMYYAQDHPGATVKFNIPVSDSGYSNGVFNIHLTG